MQGKSGKGGGYCLSRYIRREVSPVEGIQEGAQLSCFSDILRSLNKKNFFEFQIKEPITWHQ